MKGQAIKAVGSTRGKSGALTKETTDSTNPFSSYVVTENTVRNDGRTETVGINSTAYTVADSVASVAAIAFIAATCITTITPVSAHSASRDIIGYSTITDDWTAAHYTGNRATITVSCALAAITTPLAIVNRFCCRQRIRVIWVGLWRLPPPRPILTLITIATMSTGNCIIGYNTVLDSGRSASAINCPPKTVTRNMFPAISAGRAVSVNSGSGYKAISPQRMTSITISDGKPYEPAARPLVTVEHKSPMWEIFVSTTVNNRRCNDTRVRVVGISITPHGNRFSEKAKVNISIPAVDTRGNNDFLTSLRCVYSILDSGILP
jgi:hypothetical protein